MENAFKIRRQEKEHGSANHPIAGGGTKKKWRKHKEGTR
jgi:hypothetical protein